jgi:hypothetical protein
MELVTVRLWVSEVLFRGLTAVVWPLSYSSLKFELAQAHSGQLGHQVTRPLVQRAVYYVVVFST